MAFKTIHTKYGLSAMSSAEAAGTPINLTHMAVGDGNGNPVEPDWEQTQLVRERYRSTINRVYQDPVDSTRFTAELVVPASEGGWTMRELAVFDAAGSMFVVGNLPETYKPLPEEGSFGDAVLRLAFVVTNATVVNVMVDPNVAVASQAWVINNLTAATIIPGGTVGQLLGKASNSDGDYEWQNPDAINVTVNTVAEKQLLAASQTVVDLTVTTTYGLAVYVDGLRLDMGSGAGEWQPHATIETRLTLGQSYPAGTRITLVNNEPAGSAPAPLERNRNLSDVQDKALSRQNLDVFSQAETRQMAPPGLVAHFARNTAPVGWLKANGAAISRTAYADLYAALGNTFGAGDGFTTFNLPDLRGEFIRGWDDGRGVDGGREFGSSQSGSIQSHAHTASSADAGSHAHSGTAVSNGGHSHSASSGDAGWHGHAASSDAAGWHGHDASSSTAGNHAHNASSGAAGSHAHNYGGGQSWTNSGSFSGDTIPSTVRNYTMTTDEAGNHAHTVSVAAAGDHGHVIYIAGNGAHAHAINIGGSGTHSHAVSIGTGGAHEHTLSIGAAGAHSHTITIAATGSAETRPRNVALLACVKF